MPGVRRTRPGQTPLQSHPQAQRGRGRTITRRACERSVEIQIPSVSSRNAAMTAPEPKIVNVHRDGHIALGSRDVTIDELRQRLAAARAEYPGLNVLVRGDELASHGQMTTVYDACKQAGIAELAISVKLENQRR